MTAPPHPGQRPRFGSYADPADWAWALRRWHDAMWPLSVADHAEHVPGWAPFMVVLQVQAAERDERLPFPFPLGPCDCRLHVPYLGPRGGGPWWTEEEQPSPGDNSAVCNGERDLREAVERAHGAARAARRAAAAAPGDGMLAMKLRRAKAQWRAARSAWVRAVEIEARRQMGEG